MTNRKFLKKRKDAYYKAFNTSQSSIAIILTGFIESGTWYYVTRTQEGILLTELPNDVCVTI